MPKAGSRSPGSSRVSGGGVPAAAHGTSAAASAVSFGQIAPENTGPVVPTPQDVKVEVVPQGRMPPPPPGKPGSSASGEPNGKQAPNSKKNNRRQSNSNRGKGGGRTSGGGKSEDSGPSDRDEHPWKVGATLEVMTWDPVQQKYSSRKYCDIVETAKISRMSDNPDPSLHYKYYVHYHGLNRRMDEWVGVERVTKPPSVAKAQAKAQKEEVERARRELEKESTLEDLGIRTRRQKRKIGEIEEEDTQSTQGGHHPHMMDIDDEHDEHHGLDEASIKEHEEVTKNVNGVELGRYRMECWYFSPFPKEYYPDGYIDTLYFCEFSLKYFRHKTELVRYQRVQNPPRHPPGNEIYRSGGLAMFEVDGSDQKEYGQNLCSLAKLFLDHKTLYYDVDPFLFYIMCEVDEYGFHPVGYFSKEKYSDMGYNLACILTFPAYQRKGYGRFLIAFSYELSKKEEKVGSPEKPLSDLGAAAYRSYWASVIIQAILKYQGQELSVMDVSKITSIVSEDVIDTMLRLTVLRYQEGEHHLQATPEFLRQLMEKYPMKEPHVDPAKVHWTPLVTSAKEKDKFHIKNKLPPRVDPVEEE